MSMLDRYRKPGGFVQLLALIETCNPSKQKRLLEIIEQEDRLWADTVRAKMLTLERIFSWRDETLSTVFETLQDLTVAVTLHTAAPDFKKRISGLIASARVRKIEDLLNSSGPTIHETAATHLKIVESVRQMGLDGLLRFESIDPNLVIGDDVAKRLAQAETVAGRLENEKPTAAGESRLVELQTLKKRVSDLSQENAVLRHELSMARSKLDQIKKIA